MYIKNRKKLEKALANLIKEIINQDVKKLLCNIY